MISSKVYNGMDFKFGTSFQTESALIPNLGTGLYEALTTSKERNPRMAECPAQRSLSASERKEEKVYSIICCLMVKI